MSEAWSTQTLSEICEIRPAKRQCKDGLSDADMVSFVPMEDLPIGRMFLTASQKRELGKVYSGYTYFADGDVLLAKITPCFQNGKLSVARDLTNSVGFGSSEFFVFRPSDNVSAEFLYYFLSRKSFRDEGVSKMSGAVGHQRVPKEFIEELSVPLPPLPEQKRIVSILDEAFGAIERAKENAQKNLANARELFESYLNRVFTEKGEGWEEKTLKDISQINSGGTPLKSTEVFWEGGDIPWYSSGELNDLYTTDSKKFITDAGLNGSNAKLLPPGSLLMGMYDTAALKMSILDRDGTFNQAVAGMWPVEGTDPQFLLYAVRHVRPEVLKLRRGVRQKNLSLAKIKAIAIRIPKTLKEQHAVVDHIAKTKAETSRLETIYTRTLTALDELKQSILQKAFTGQLTAKSPELEAVG